MIKTKERVLGIFDEIDPHLHFPIRLFLIGGGAMILLNLKPSTKDLDIVATSEDDARELNRAAHEAGFHDSSMTKGGERFSPTAILEKDDARIDLLAKKVCGKLSLSEAMEKRAKPAYKGKQIEVLICSNEDIFVFKTITEREGDREDCQELIKSGLNWNAILDEINYQVKIGGSIWITYINESLEKLETNGFTIPIIKKTQQLTLEWNEENAKKYSM